MILAQRKPNAEMLILARQSRGLTQKELSALIGVDEPKMSKILHYRIDEFSTDRLIELYTKIEPNLKLMIE